MKLFIFILLSFSFLNSSLVYASDCFKPDRVKKDQKQVNKEVSVASNKKIQKPIPKHVLKKAQKSVWQIEDSLGSGTGFFISPSEFVTNFHVVANTLKRNADNFVLNRKNSHKNLRIKKIKHLSPLSDLAILEIEGEVSNYLNLSEKDPGLKESLSLIGYPKRKFKIVDKIRDIYYENEMEYTYAAKHGDYHGASGSPVLNSKGEVVGVFRASFKDSISVVKIIHLKNLLKQDSPSFKKPKHYLKHFIKELELLAESGDMIARFRLGVLYQRGQGVKKNLKKAALWYKKAAEQGHVTAQNLLGLAYYEGHGVKKDIKETAFWYEKAAEQGNAPAQFNLGIMYATGQGVEKDLEEAARWFRKAAEQGYAEAQNNLGFLYINGWGVEQDPKEAAYWFEKAAEQKLVEAQFQVGVMYEEGLGVEKDLEEAARWFKKAAKQGHAPAQFRLGVMYRKGQGVKKNTKKAARWIRKAAKQGHAPAREMLEKNPELKKGEQVDFLDLFLGLI